MVRVYRYLTLNFFQTFLSLFFTLFFLASVIFFIKISSLTSLFSVTFSDLGEAYLYVLPQIIVYSLPITFFISVAMTLYKLSNENEIIVMFALTLSPNKIAKLFFFISLFVTLFLLVNSVVMIPISKQLNKNFIAYKKLQAKINLKSSSYGQRFGDWNLFVKSNSKDSYKDIVLYNSNAKKGEERFVIAKEARMDHNNSVVSIVLQNGKLYNFGKDKIDEFSYDDMVMSYNPKIKELHYYNVKDYWMRAKDDRQRAKDLSINVLISFFPLATFLFALSFGIAHTRTQKSNIYLYMFFVVLFYYLLMYFVSLNMPLYGSVAMIVLVHFAGGFVFYKRILKRY
jgi:lipopolysaccharide export system permease protein